LRVVARRERFLRNLNFFILAVKAFLLALANDFLSVDLELVTSRRKAGVKRAVGDDGAFASETASLFYKGDSATCDGLPIERHETGNRGSSL